MPGGIFHEKATFCSSLKVKHNFVWQKSSFLTCLSSPDPTDLSCDDLRGPGNHYYIHITVTVTCEISASFNCLCNILSYILFGNFEMLEVQHLKLPARGPGDPYPVQEKLLFQSGLQIFFSPL